MYIDSTAAFHFSEALKLNNSISKLTVSRSLQGLDSMKMVLEAILENGSIEYVDLTGGFLGSQKCVDLVCRIIEEKSVFDVVPENMVDAADWISVICSCAVKCNSINYLAISTLRSSERAELHVDVEDFLSAARLPFLVWLYQKDLFAPWIFDGVQCFRDCV